MISNLLGVIGLELDAEHLDWTWRSWKLGGAHPRTEGGTCTTRTQFPCSAHTSPGIGALSWRLAAGTDSGRLRAQLCGGHRDGGLTIVSVPKGRIKRQILGARELDRIREKGSQGRWAVGSEDCLAGGGVVTRSEAGGHGLRGSPS